MYGLAEKNRIPLTKDYVVALYIRLSLEDDDLGEAKRESDSITNQRALLKEYMKENLIEKVLVFEGGIMEIVWSYGDSWVYTHLETV